MSNMLIRSPGEQPWEEPKNVRYGLEADLQRILAQHPSLLPGVSSGAKASKEFHSEAGRTDLVVVDTDGSLTLVECKLASNPQIRREIFGQMFAYASRFWKMNVTDFESQWSTRTNESLFASGEDDDLNLRDAVATNLAEGRFRIVLAIDEINLGLKRMIEYLNSMAGPETTIIAVEYTRLTSGDVEILMPQTYGEEIAEAKVAAEERQQRAWTVDEYSAWLGANDRGSSEKFTLLIETAEKHGIRFVGSPLRVKSSIPTGGLRIEDERYGWIETLYFYHYTGGSTFLELNFTN